MNRHRTRRSSSPTSASRAPRACTLLELVQDVTDGTATDAECVVLVSALLKTGQAVLTGNFKGQTLD